jgi:hypothetical protein
MISLNKALIYILIAVLAPFGANTQLNIINQYGFGGDGISWNPKICISENNGLYILFATNSAQGTGNFFAPTFGGSDLVLHKYDSQLNLEWVKSYGGGSDDGFGWIYVLNDGVLILSESTSMASGNKTVSTNGSADGWLLKLDFDGEIVWQKGFGGVDYEAPYGLTITEQNDIVMAFRSFSGVSGTRSVPLKGTQDFWVVKTDSDGEIIWDRSFGSDGEEILFAIDQLSDGTILLSGASIGANISHDKTEAPYSSVDNWIIAIDSDGDVVWDKTIGGSGFESRGHVVSINDTIYHLGSSSSGVSGLRNEPLKGFEDLWLTKLDNNGNILSHYFYGGDKFDIATGIQLIEIDKILLCSRSDSDASYDKSENGRGGLDFWGLIIDLQGNVLGEKTLGGNLADDLSTGVLFGNRLILGGSSLSGATGDKTIPKFHVNNTSFDVWIVELDATTLEVLEYKHPVLMAYPNPVDDFLNLELGNSSTNHKVEVYNTAGILMWGQNLDGSSTKIKLDFSGFANGVYTVVVKGDLDVRTVKVVK